MKRTDTQRLALAALLIGWMSSGVKGDEDPRVLLEVGRDYPETRLFDACPVAAGPGAPAQLAVAGFSRAEHGDIADLSVFEWHGDNLVLRWRLLRGGTDASSIRTLRAADLDGDGRDELIALGRIGNEEADSRGELQVFRREAEHWKLAAAERWQSGQYTHGYGLDIADLDGDQTAEIVSGGFFALKKGEQGELRVWKFGGGKLRLIAATAWGSESGHTRVNAVCAGDVTGDGKPEIVTAGRTGQIKAGEHVNAYEADQLVVWRLEGSRLVRHANYESEKESRSRFRSLALADMDGLPGLELLAVGRHEPATPGSGGKRGGGGGRGSKGGGGGGGGKGGGRGGAEQVAAVRPLATVFQLKGGSVKRVFDVDFGDAFGEVRDVEVLSDVSGRPQVVTITASELKPGRSARLDVWEAKDLALAPQKKQIAILGDETRARQLVVWGPAERRRLLTVGFVTRGEQILGQILDFGLLSRPSAATQQ